MIVTTKYKRYQFVLEWVTMGAAILWLTAALILLNNYCDTENEIFKRNLLMMSMIVDALSYLGFTVMSFLPHGNSLIKSKKYLQGDKAYQYKKESRLRSFALISKLIFILIAVFMGVYKYIF